MGRREGLLEISYPSGEIEDFALDIEAREKVYEKFRDRIFACFPVESWPGARRTERSIIFPVPESLRTVRLLATEARELLRIFGPYGWKPESEFIGSPVMRRYDGQQMRLGRLIRRLLDETSKPGWREREMRRRQNRARRGDENVPAPEAVDTLPPFSPAMAGEARDILRRIARHTGSSLKRPVAVLTLDPVENAHMSARRGWVSCYDPERYEDPMAAWENLECALGRGDLVLWLTEEDDAETIDEPTARTRILVLLPRIDEDEVSLRFKVSETYGEDPEWWHRVVDKIVQALNRNCARFPGEYVTIPVRRGKAREREQYREVEPVRYDHVVTIGRCVSGRVPCPAGMSREAAVRAARNVLSHYTAGHAEYVDALRAFRENPDVAAEWAKLLPDRIAAVGPIGLGLALLTDPGWIEARMGSAGPHMTTVALLWAFPDIEKAPPRVQEFARRWVRRIVRSGDDHKIWGMVSAVGHFRMGDAVGWLLRAAGPETLTVDDVLKLLEAARYNVKSEQRLPPGIVREVVRRIDRDILPREPERAIALLATLEDIPEQTKVKFIWAWARSPNPSKSLPMSIKDDTELLKKYREARIAATFADSLMVDYHNVDPVEAVLEWLEVFGPDSTAPRSVGIMYKLVNIRNIDRDGRAFRMSCSVWKQMRDVLGDERMKRALEKIRPECFGREQKLEETAQYPAVCRYFTGTAEKSKKEAYEEFFRPAFLALARRPDVVEVGLDPMRVAIQIPVAETVDPAFARELTVAVRGLGWRLRDWEKGTLVHEESGRVEPIEKVLALARDQKHIGPATYEKLLRRARLERGLRAPWRYVAVVSFDPADTPAPGAWVVNYRCADMLGGRRDPEARRLLERVLSSLGFSVWMTTRKDGIENQHPVIGVHLEPELGPDGDLGYRAVHWVGNRYPPFVSALQSIVWTVEEAVGRAGRDEEPAPDTPREEALPDVYERIRNRVLSVSSDEGRQRILGRVLTGMMGFDPSDPGSAARVLERYPRFPQLVEELVARPTHGPLVALLAAAGSGNVPPSVWTILGNLMRWYDGTNRTEAAERIAADIDALGGNVGKVRRYLRAVVGGNPVVERVFDDVLRALGRET